MPQSCRQKNPRKPFPILISKLEPIVQEKLVQRFLEFLGKTCYEVTDPCCPICCTSKASHSPMVSRTPAFLPGLGGAREPVDSEHCVAERKCSSIQWQAFKIKTLFKKKCLLLCLNIRRSPQEAGAVAGLWWQHTGNHSDGTATLSIVTLVITGAVDHRIIWSGRDLKDPLAPTPLHSTREGCSKLRPTWLWILLGMEHPQPLCTTCSSVSLPSEQRTSS